jgi:threonine dehydratase
LRPDARLYGAEPETAAPLAASLKAGAAVRFPGWRASFVDGAGGKSVLPSMWPLLESTVSDSIVVTLKDAADAMRFTAERARVIIEGAAACAVAAARSPRITAEGHRKVVAVVSGGNIDLGRFAALTGICDSP